MSIPPIIKELDEQLIALLQKDNLPYIAAKDIAEYLGMDVDTLRTAAENGTCPFAIGGRAGRNANRFTKIPKLAFYNWVTQGVMYKQA